MRYLVYSTVGNLHGIDEYLGYSELDDQGYWSRYVEIRTDGTALRYSEDRPADRHGQLPEKTWPEDESVVREFGVMMPLTKALFETVWQCTHCLNDVKTS